MDPKHGQKKTPYLVAKGLDGGVGLGARPFFLMRKDARQLAALHDRALHVLPPARHAQQPAHGTTPRARVSSKEWGEK